MTDTSRSCTSCAAALPADRPRKRLCDDCRTSRVRARTARYRAAVLATDREGFNAYHRAYYRARNQPPACEQCGQPVHHGNARLCPACCPWEPRRAAKRKRPATRGTP